MSITTREFARFSFLAHTAFFALQFLYLWLDDVVRGDAGTAGLRAIEEATGSYGAFALSFVLLVAWRRAPLRGPRLLRRIPGYLALTLVLSAVHTTLLWGSRSLLVPLAGLGTYDYGRMPLRYLMELPAMVIGNATLLAVIALVESARARRAHERAQAELERSLVGAQLQNLRLQMQPHFLFNALNTISSRLADDPVGADALLGRLAELLRASLRTNESAEVPLGEEWELLEAYGDLMRARFGDRLTLEVDRSAAPTDLHVPPLLLQPLVENAVRHGGLERTGRSRIRVTAREEGDLLRIRVVDDGPGVPAGRDPLTNGTGLGATARRLTLLYGDRARLEAGNLPDGGFAVEITLPARRP